MSETLRPDNVFSTNYKTYTHHVDPFFHAKETFLFEVLQEAAGRHASLKKLSIPDLNRERRTWMITRTRLEIDRYTIWPEDIHVQTWGQEPVKLFFTRGTKGCLADGSPLFTAISWWAVIDTLSGRPVRPQEINDRLGIPPVDNDHPRIDSSYNKRLFFADQDLIPLKEFTPSVRYEDTDSNHHVNNVAYVNWLMEALPDEFRNTYKMSWIDVSWLNQTYRHDTVRMLTGIFPGEGLDSPVPHLFHQLLRVEQDGSQTPLFIAETRWKHRAELVPAYCEQKTQPNISETAR
ncbi:acyl-[acyl-carrier-protein] thioesterase [Parasphaerochaeta coccoides]|uniref:Acyl-ACP thioesterase n=1 Tax=Parasphaerochaeta coccoides (strain ATCC BAA-1237 / DSM 17374 / SPN1) TaxID=760011 RepID=F4GLV6_PARC1|nr:acyl-ACP thioesterase domain-containing protein [Parasphaerochaeta coccoides]AEC02997.1 acyl-ACP thioesterase [Parasphaerochaeta coccoides DSM 17374]